MPNIPKEPNQDVLDIIDRDILYFPVSGRLIWFSPKSNRCKIGQRVGALTKEGYLACGIQKQNLKVHHVCWYKFYGEWPKLELDHRDGIKVNNAILNLREVTHKLNIWNISTARYDNLLGIKGIEFVNRKNPYYLRVCTNGVTVSKTFATLEQAIKVRDEYYEDRSKSKW